MLNEIGSLFFVLSFQVDVLILLNVLNLIQLTN